MSDLPRSLTRPLRGTIARYASAIGLCVISTLLRFAIDDWLPPGFPYLTFFPAVIMATFIAGRGPGILCAILCGLAAWYWWISPIEAFMLDGKIAVALLFYAFVVAVDIALIDGLQSRHLRLVDSQRQLEQMAEHQTLLFKELQHRVANNLASVASMLRLQRREIERNPALALSVIDRADARIALMGRVHRQLYDPLAADVAVPEHIAEIVRHACEVAGRNDVSVAVDAEPVRIEISRLMTLSLLISELLTNSLKHAFAPGETGQVTVSLKRAADGRLALCVADNGRGMTARAPGESKGLGTAIAKGLAVQLGGTIEVVSDGGLRTTVRFPED